MINAYVRELGRIMEEDPRVLAFWTDHAVGACLRTLADGYPDRCRVLAKGRNAMLEAAIEAADDGYEPWLHLVPVFPSSQGVARIRSGVFAPNRSIRITGMVGIGEETRQPQAGRLSDTGIMRSMPGSVVMVPSDALCMRAVIRHSHATAAGVYIRVSNRPCDPVYPEGTAPFPLSVSMLRRGVDTVLLAAGPTVGTCVRCSDLLREQGVSVAVGDLHTIKPLDEGHIRRLGLTHGRIWAIEEHPEYGGVYSAISEALADIGMSGRLNRIDLASLEPTPSDGDSAAERLGRHILEKMGMGSGADDPGTHGHTDSEQALDLKRVLNPRIRIL